MDLTLDLERNPVDELRCPRTRRHDHSVKVVYHFSDRCDPRIAYDPRDLGEHRDHRRLRAEDAGLLVEDSHVFVTNHVAGITLAQLDGVENFDIETMRLRGRVRTGDGFR